MTLLYYSLFCFSAVSIASGFVPATYPPLQTPVPECSTGYAGTGELLVDKELKETIEQVQQQLGPPGCNPPRNRSCQEILHCFPSAPSGHYQITGSNGSLPQVYCDMEGTNCGGEGGWTRVAYVNMSQSGTNCPHGLTQRNFTGKNYCGRNITGCQSTVFPTHGLSYSRVCGRLRGYQFGGTDAFNASIVEKYTSVDSNYVDGVSITYGKNPRTHLWTYAVGSLSSRHLQFDCPCNNDSSYQAPSFIGSEYYCESGVASISDNQAGVFHNYDLLWDGQQCTSLEGPCCTHSNMPWFNKTLSETTTENIELRLCGDDSPTDDEDVPIELIELYIR